jgi:hemerythrin
MIKYKPQPEFIDSNDIIDQQHNEILSCLSSIRQIDLDNIDYDKFIPQLSRLVQAVREHFDYEDKYLKSIGFKELVHHQEEHVVILDNLKSIETAYLQNRNENLGQLLKSVCHWFEEHLEKEDKKYTHVRK